MYDGHWFAGGFMWLFWVLLILVVFLVIKATMSGSTQGGQTPADKSPLQLLEERLARGEIDEEEFERKRNLLKKLSAEACHVQRIIETTGPVGGVPKIQDPGLLSSSRWHTRGTGAVGDSRRRDAVC